MNGREVAVIKIRFLRLRRFFQFGLYIFHHCTENALLMEGKPKHLIPEIIAQSTCHGEGENKDVSTILIVNVKLVEFHRFVKDDLTLGKIIDTLIGRNTNGAFDDIKAFPEIMAFPKVLEGFIIMNLKKGKQLRNPDLFFWDEGWIGGRHKTPPVLF